MTPCEGSAAMETYAREKTAALLATMAEALNAAARDPHADAVHDMRVSIRRLQQGVRLFREFLPKRAVRDLRKKMRAVMERAGELRNYDIALELAAKSPHLLPMLNERRAAAQQGLAGALAQVAAEDLGARWAGLLKLGAR